MTQRLWSNLTLNKNKQNKIKWNWLSHVPNSFFLFLSFPLSVKFKVIVIFLIKVSSDHFLMYLSIHPYVCLSIYPFITYLSIHLSIYLSIHSFTYLSVYPCIYLFIPLYLFIHLSHASPFPSPWIPLTSQSASFAAITRNGPEGRRDLAGLGRGGGECEGRRGLPESGEVTQLLRQDPVRRPRNSGGGAGG